MYRLFFTLCLASLSIYASAQNRDKLFGGDADKIKARNGFIIMANGDFDLPGGDMAQRFGPSFRIGPGVLYKTASNWMIGIKGDFIFGSVVHQDSLMANIKDKYSGGGSLFEFINNGGERIGVPVYERGYAIGVQGGKIFAFSDRFPDNGIMVLGSAGFVQHKIDIYDKDKTINSIVQPYIKGYDRLTNGPYAEGYAGYVFFANNKFLNFTLGVDALFGFTQGRRNYLYDVMRSDNEKRLDVLFGLRGSWMFPVFKRKSEDILFE